MDKPVKSSVFFGWSCIVASITSLTLSGVDEKLKTGISLLKLSSGGLSKEFISLTIALEIEVKNSLNKFAISAESVTVRLFTIRHEIDDDFSDFLFMASLIRFQVCLALDWLRNSCFSKNIFFADLRILLYTLQKVLNKVLEAGEGLTSKNFSSSIFFHLEVSSPLVIHGSIL